MAQRRPQITVTLNNVANVAKAIEELAQTRVLVGIPADKTTRDDPSAGINNASLLYIHEHGAPEINLPAREVMGPTIKENQAMVAADLKAAGVAAFEGKPEQVAKIAGRLGQKIADLCRVRIQSHIPPPLKESTVLARTRRTARYQNAKPVARARMRAQATTPAAIADAVPLFDTGQLSRAITWVIRKVPIRTLLRAIKAP
jgi:hypothetical protein